MIKWYFAPCNQGLIKDFGFDGLGFLKHVEFRAEFFTTLRISVRFFNTLNFQRAASEDILSEPHFDSPTLLTKRPDFNFICSS